MGIHRESVLVQLNTFRGMSKEEQRSVLIEEINKGSELVKGGQCALFSVIDDTKAGGGMHSISFLYDPSRNSVYLEAPKPSIHERGQFPTVLHALEVVVITASLARTREEASYPRALFVPSLKKFELETVYIPLVLSSDNTHIVALHRQARRIDPEVLARGYYEVIKQDTSLPSDLIRHTMLVQPLTKSEEVAADKRTVTVSVWPSQEARGRYKLAHPGRIASWFNADANRDIAVLKRD